MNSLYERILAQLDGLIADVRYSMAIKPDPNLDRAYVALTTCRGVFRSLAAAARNAGGRE